MDLDANCSTLGANGALAEIVAKHIPEANIGPAAHAVPPNLSQISGIMLLVAVQPNAKCLSVHFASKIIITTPPTLRFGVPGLHYIMGGGWEMVKAIVIVTASAVKPSDLTLP